jgi:peptide/nickel transport system substrate-binding protein
MAERAVIHRAIRVATEDTFTSLRPERYASMTDIQIGLQIFETLVGYDRSLRLEGRLAQSWECSPDGLGYRFVLRPGARFHDGEPVTATAVRDFLAGTCLERLGVRPLAASVEAIGSREVELRLRRPFSPLLDRLAAPAAVVYSTAGARDGELPAGTGAFGRPRRVGRSVHVEALGEQAVSSAEFVPHVGGVDMWRALVEDRIDLAYECPYEVVECGADDPSVVVTSCPSLAVNMLLFNVRSGPLAAPAARRAIAKAIDKHQLLADVNRGVGKAAQGPIAPSSPFFVPRPPQSPASSLERGAAPAELAVLATVGFTPHWLELFKSQLERVGTRCVVRQLPFPALLRALRQHSFEAALIGFPGFVDPDRVLFEVFHSAGRANYSGVSDPGFDDFVDRARRSHAEEERAELYAGACAVLEDLAPAVFLRHGVSIIARRSRITGVDPHPLGDIDLAKAGWRSEWAEP